MIKPKNKIPIQLWIFLIISIITFIFGFYYKYHYIKVTSSLKNEVEENILNGNTDFSFIDESGEERSIFVGSNYGDYTKSMILEKKYGEDWIFTHTTLSNTLIIIGIISLLKFLYSYYAIVKSHEFVNIFVVSFIILLIGVFVSWLSFQDTEHIGQLIIILLTGISIICVSILYLTAQLHRYKLRTEHPDLYMELVNNEAKQRFEKEQENQRIYEAEKDAAINGTSNSPWDIKYLPYPCPYCNRYRVRHMKWEDKRASVMFWGAHSMQIGKHYICDNCKKSWE